MLTEHESTTEHFLHCRNRHIFEEFVTALITRLQVYLPVATRSLSDSRSEPVSTRWAGCQHTGSSPCVVGVLVLPQLQEDLFPPSQDNSLVFSPLTLQHYLWAYPHTEAYSVQGTLLDPRGLTTLMVSSSMWTTVTLIDKETNAQECLNLGFSTGS